MQVIWLKTSAAGGVTWEEVAQDQLASSSGQGDKAPKKTMKVDVPKWCGKWAVQMDDYKPGVVGAKSKNLAGLLLPLPVMQLLVCPDTCTGSCAIHQPLCLRLSDA